MVIGACVAAPVFEEMLFRGHLQTLLVRLLMPAQRAGSGGLGVLGSGPEAAAAVEVLDESSQTPDPRPQAADPQTLTVTTSPPRARRWLAVLITSLLFAIVHPIWMAPAIFVLAICLGYAYERTGNLWVPILIHAAFNTSSTLVFLNPQ
jgi:membrane protease YdiL (CAAX protease family)